MVEWVGGCVMKRMSIGVAALMAAMMLSPASAQKQDLQKQDLQKQELQKLSIVVFGSPSLGAFLPPVIKAQKLDEKNGLSITFEERTPDAYTAQFSVVNTATPGLVGYALADRATAIQIWEPAYTTLRAKKPGIKMLDLKIAESWQKATGSKNIPYLGVAAHTDWAEKNKDLIPKLYAAYREAGEWTAA